MGTQVACYFCNWRARGSALSTSKEQFKCDNCGYFILPRSILHFDKYEGKKHIIAGYLHETRHLRDHDESLSQEDNTKKAIIDGDRINSILSDPITPKTVVQRLDKLILHIYRASSSLGHHININDVPPSVAYAVDHEEVKAMFDELVDMEYGKYERLEPGTYGFGSGGSVPEELGLNTNIFILTTKGHSRAEELISTNINSNKVFVAMGFKDDLLSAMENSIKPACRDCGFDAYLISDKEHNNGITDEIIIGIKTSKFVITDFTYNNCGAYFEAGYAQGLGREVIRCCKKEWFDGVDENGNKNRLHFDVQHYNFILWENEDDLRVKLKNRIRAIIPDANMSD